MRHAQSIQSDITEAANEVMEDCPHALPPISELMCKLSDADQYRDQLLKMVHVSNKYMQNTITQLQHQLLLEFTSVQAAKAGIPSDELLDEICRRYGLINVQRLKIRDFWEALLWCYTYKSSRIQ